ncbi:transglutaminase superfamily protein [Knoellia remsis]|uniref:Transglutaminase superfamily protein n=1 Tax=Knoellia remsis TaxID=407159 RepID=A0A2T0ULF3_9MICO|nr:transglutaminase-like domain-containing protein [Knoellia remsis]PRY58765.1 transglutaminase superfamily protein [Knoellia remsis]
MSEATQSRRELREEQQASRSLSMPSFGMPSRDALVDLAFALVLVGIALVGFRTGFIGWEWVLAAGAGVVLGTLVAHVAVARSWPLVLTALVLVAVHFLLGGPFAVRGDLIGGVVPSLQTLRDLATAPVTGWKEWLTLLPPVDARGPLVALPWVTGLVGSALTYGVARRFRSVSAAAIAPVVLLAGSIALGTQQPAAKLVQGVVFALVLILWLVARSARTRAALQNGAGRQARTVTGVALLAVAAVAGTFLGPFLPGTDEGAARAVVRSELTPPYDVAQFTSPLSGFREYTEPNAAELYDKEILSVSGLPDGTPVRFATLDSYDGLVWGAADRAMDGTPFQQVGSRIAPRATGESATVTVTVPEGGYDGVWLPLAGSTTGISFTGARSDDLADALWLNTATETAAVPASIGPGDSYTFDTVLTGEYSTKLPAELDVASGGQISQDTSFLDSKLDAWTGQESGAWQKLVAVAKTMSSEGAYTDGGTANSYEKVYLPGHSLGRLSRFVGSTQLAGNDEQYAATLALVGNRLGIPSRVVMGAIPEAGGVVKGKDVHAWVEVQQDNGTWHALLPSTFLPDRNKKPNEQQLKSEEQKVGAQVPPPAGVNPPSVLQGPDQAQNATDIKKKKRNPLDIGAWPLWLKILVLGILLPILLAVGIWALIRWLKARRRRKHATTGPTPARAAWVWRDLVSDARSLGVAVPRGATRLEQAAAFPEGVTAAPIAAGANAAVFGPGDPEPEVAVGLLEEADGVRRELRGHTSRWRRLRSDLSLRPFFERDPRTRTAARRLPSLPALRRTKATGGASA